MRRGAFIACLAIFPAVASAALEHRARDVGGVMIYPEFASRGSIDRKYIPGGVPRRDLWSRFGRDAAAAMYGTIDAALMRKIYPNLIRSEAGWGKTAADGIVSGSLDGCGPGSTNMWILVELGDFADFGARSFRDHGPRLAELYTLMRRLVWNDYLDMVNMLEFSSSFIPGQMVSVPSSDWTDEFYEAVPGEVFARYAVLVLELDRRDLNSVALFSGGRHWEVDIYGDGEGNGPQLSPLTFYPRSWPADYAVFDSGSNPDRTRYGRYYSWGGETVKYSTILTRIAPGLTVSTNTLRLTERIAPDMFAFPNAMMAAADLQFLPWDSETWGPTILYEVIEAEGMESASVATVNVSSEIKLREGRVVSVDSRICDGGDVKRAGGRSGERAVRTQWPSAGHLLRQSSSVELAGAFSSVLGESAIARLAKMIPQDDTRTFSIQIDWIAPELSVGGGNAGMLIMLLRSPDGAVVADMSWPYSLPDMSVTGMVNRVSMSSDVRGKVWLPHRIIDYPTGRPENSQRDTHSLRAVRPHPVAEEYISGFCCNELLAVVVVTNEETIAAGTLIDRGRYFDNVKKGDGEILWKLSSRAESSTALLEAALQGDSALISRLSLEGGKTLGRTLASASTFDGRIAEGCARNAARDAASNIDRAPAYDGHVPMTLRRIVSGGQSDGFELAVGLVGDPGYSRGDIRDVHDCLRWTFGMSRVVAERAIPPSAAEGGSAVRHLVLRWAFPAMSAAD